MASLSLGGVSARPRTHRCHEAGDRPLGIDQGRTAFAYDARGTSLDRIGERPASSGEAERDLQTGWQNDAPLGQWSPILRSKDPSGLPTAAGTHDQSER